MNEIFVPDIFEVEPQNLKEKAGLANTLLKIFADNIQLTIQTTHKAFNSYLPEYLKQLVKQEYLAFFNQFKCFSIDNGSVTRSWDGHREEYNAYLQKRASKCSSCVLYAHCNVAGGVDKPKFKNQEQKPQNPNNLSPLDIYNQMFYHFFPERQYVLDIQHFNLWLEDDYLAERAYKLLHMTYSIAGKSLTDFVDELNLPISASNLNRKFKELELELKPQGVQNPTHLFCDVIKWREDYLDGMSSEKIAKKYNLDTINPISYINSYFRKYNFKNISPEELNQNRARKNIQYQHYHSIHRHYLDWNGTIEGFEYKYKIKWDSMLRYYYRYNYTRRTKTEAATSGKVGSIIETYQQLHSKYLQWEGTIEEFENKYGVNWTNMRKWYTRKGYETKEKEGNSKQKEIAEKYDNLHEVYLSWPGNIEQFEAVYQVNWENMKRWFSKNGYKTRGK